MFPVLRTDFFKVTLSVIVCISSSELSERNELPIHPRINLKLQDLEEGAVLLPGESRQTPFPKKQVGSEESGLAWKSRAGSALPALPRPSLCSFTSGRCPWTLAKVSGGISFHWCALWAQEKECNLFGRHYSLLFLWWRTCVQGLFPPPLFPYLPQLNCS